MDYFYLLPLLAAGDVAIEFSATRGGPSEEDYFDFFYHKSGEIPADVTLEFSIRGSDPAVLDTADVLPCSAGFLISRRMLEAISHLISSEIESRGAAVRIGQQRNDQFVVFRTRKDLPVLQADPEKFQTWINALVRTDLADSFNVATDMATKEFIFSQRVIDIAEKTELGCSWKKIRNAR
ncbi:hypothetical protein N7E02_07145 (plasmid) [Aliirhizobium terrae]|uniref:hypothetical protein n=1 Tax=Terrirhizobium terrae TaxID=2926709 RepID=UPI0025784459|nr:hypothetical protein [Rhizobium sp. CC-CFT758]WJH38405.1 hypothetical protein N7E02_07145 [Rhizobium sp. CC-CFT758]